MPQEAEILTLITAELGERGAIIVASWSLLVRNRVLLSRDGGGRPTGLTVPGARCRTRPPPGRGARPTRGTARASGGHPGADGSPHGIPARPCGAPAARRR